MGIDIFDDKIVVGVSHKRAAKQEEHQSDFHIFFKGSFAREGMLFNTRLVLLFLDLLPMDCSSLQFIILS